MGIETHSVEDCLYSVNVPIYMKAFFPLLYFVSISLFNAIQRDV